MIKENYEVALSYAHKDEEIAKIIKKEFKDIFDGCFFMDILKQEELASAEVFEEEFGNGEVLFGKTGTEIL
ncbi:MAG: hypothetical protein HFH68_04605 [Lachnospiraceae bacterium]|nr:hypothetical protein [Lachnospiraceae bacterium]